MSGYTFCDGFNRYIKNTNGSVRNFSALANASGKITGLGVYLSSCNSSSNLNVNNK